MGPLGDRFDEFATAATVFRRTLATGCWGSADLRANRDETDTGPPIHFGTWGAGVELAARDYDGWIASGLHRNPDELDEAISRYRQAGGRTATVSTVVVGPDTDPGELRDRFARYEAAGFDRAVVLIADGGPTPSEVRSLVD